jgi:hypothetical protein
MRKNILVLFVLFSVLYSFNLYAAKENLEIPFRIIDKKVKNLNLQKGDIEFYINGKKTGKYELTIFERNMSDKGLPLRYYVLVFNIFDYYEDIGQGIDYFVDNILKNEPVILATRNKVYRFFNYNSKQYLKDNMKKLVKQDTIKFKAETESYRKKIKEIINAIDSGRDIKKDSAGGMKYKLQRFINEYLREWENYKSRFVYPDVRKYQMASNLLANKDGDKFIIVFQHREIIPYFKKVQKVISKMNDFISSAVSASDQSWVSMISSGINRINQSMLISETFPTRLLSDVLLLNNIEYNILFLNNKMAQKEGAGYGDISPDMEKILREVAVLTGGVAMPNDDIINTLQLIKKHSDFYYCLNTPVKAEEIKVKILPKDKKIKLAYINDYSKKFIKNLFNIRKEKVRIDNVSVLNKRIGFSIMNFNMKTLKGIRKGVLKVNILVKDDNGNILYKTGNLLNSVKKSINIKLPPINISGKYNLFIIAQDILGASSTIFEEKTDF